VNSWICPFSGPWICTSWTMMTGNSFITIREITGSQGLCQGECIDSGKG
jgi:hypothetical protein